MKKKGMIHQWNDEKGFGFVKNESGQNVFVHVKSFRKNARRPVVGDQIIFDQTKDLQGRIQAVNIAFEGDKIKQKKSNKKNNFSLLSFAIIFAAIIFITFTNVIPKFVLLIYSSLSVLSFFLYQSDKKKSKKKLFRTAEKSLLTFDLLGGWPGGFIAQRMFRHKVSKTEYQIKYWVCVLINIAALTWLIYTGNIYAIQSEIYQILK